MPGSEKIQALWREASPSRRAMLVAAPAVIAALAIFGIAMGAMSMGNGDDKSALAPTATARAKPTATPMPPTPTVEEVLRYFAAIMPTATAVPQYTGGSGGVAGGGGGSRAGLTGPGPIVTTDIHLSIPRIGVNGGVHGRTVGTNGVMGDPIGAYMVMWYDFRPYSGGIGGYPGEPGANVVMAGHVDYIGVGPAVFFGLKNLSAGDHIVVNSANGPITYAVQWSQWASGSEDFTRFVAKNGQETITLVTCIGAFSGGQYSSRLVIRGVRV